MEKVTAIFDIGKTNKKFFLFNSDFQEVYREYQKFDLIEDEDGHPTDDLAAIENWAKELFARILKSKKFEVEAINFSTYGASLVHIDIHGKPITPLYNYTKPLSAEITKEFYQKHGGKDKICVQTASPDSGMLNSGLQLYWLKVAKPKIYEQIQYSLHLPQYLSYIFTGIPVSEYTSIGCHTMLWDYKKEDYHDWVYDEEIVEKLAPIVDTDISINMNYHDKRMKIGVGIHDSSAALIPYIRGSKKPFTLISTGTWSIALNPFRQEDLTPEELAQDSLNYMRTDGGTVRASRLFLGNEYEIKIKELTSYFKKPSRYHKTVKFTQDLYQKEAQRAENLFHFASIGQDRVQPPSSKLNAFSNFEEAYHRLMNELCELQIKHLVLADGGQNGRIYIDGGFVDNELFIESLSQRFPKSKIMTSKSALGSSLGAAIVISNEVINKKFLKKKYGIKKYLPRILSDQNNSK